MSRWMGIEDTTYQRGQLDTHRILIESWLLLFGWTDGTCGLQLLLISLFSLGHHFCALFGSLLIDGMKYTKAVLGGSTSLP